MPKTPKDIARDFIDAQLQQAAWIVQDAAHINIGAGRGVAIREYPLAKGHGTADYLLYADRKLLGIVEAKDILAAEILVDLQAALEQFALITADLTSQPKSTNLEETL